MAITKVLVGLNKKDIPILFQGQVVGKACIDQYAVNFYLDSKQPAHDYLVDKLRDNPEDIIAFYIDSGISGEKPVVPLVKTQEAIEASKLVGKILSIREILGIYNAMVAEIQELETSLKKLRGDGTTVSMRRGREAWEDGIRSDPRRSVQLLYDELVTKRANRTMLELNYAYLLQDKEVQELNDCRKVTIQPDIGHYNKYPLAGENSGDPMGGDPM